MEASDLTRSADVVLSELPVELHPRQPQNLRSAGHVASVLSQHLGNVLRLERRACLTELRRGRCGVPLLAAYRPEAARLT